MKRKEIFVKRIFYAALFVIASFSLVIASGMVDLSYITDIFNHISTVQIPIDLHSMGGSNPMLFFGAGAVVLSDVPVDDDLTAVAISYKNGRFIADEVLPYVQVSKQTFKYRKARKEDAFRMPETKVGRSSAPNRITEGWDEQSAICEDDGLDFPIPRTDIDNAKPEDQARITRNATESIMSHVLLGREYRVASLVFNANSYPTGNKATLTGTDQFSHADSTPIATILTALGIPLIRPNIMVFGQANWNVFRQHADIVKATNRNSGDAGAAARQAVAELFEVDKVLVGLGRYSSAKKGLTPVITDLWGDFLALLYIPEVLNEFSSDTFGFTGRWGGRISGQLADQNIGLRGGVIIRAGESTKEVVLESYYGYLFSDTIA